LTNATVPNPVYVRYAFRNYPTVSIYTTDVLPLPLSAFKTDYPEVLTSVDEITFGKLNNAYASSTYPDRLPLYAINGAGLIGDGHDASAVTSKAWHTNDVPCPHYFKIKLKMPQEVAAMRIWNLSWKATESTFKEIKLYVDRGVKLYMYWNMILDNTGERTWGWR
jgi:glucosylceramidase